MRKLSIWMILWAFVVVSVCPQPLYAQSVHQAPALPSLVGVRVFSAQPFRFDFIVENGDLATDDPVFREESDRLVKYFLTSLTTPDHELWVNLSPLERDRIIAPSLASTGLGRDLLSQDLTLKQLTSSLLHPDHEQGKVFWKKVYAAMSERFGVTDIPLDGLNKIWIMPDTARVYEKVDRAFVVSSHLKVMLDEDRNADKAAGLTDDISRQALREVVLPFIEEEVNNGPAFARLRQIYGALILSVWYKKRLKDGLLGQRFVNQQKTGGMELADAASVEATYERYLSAFKAGAANLVREELNEAGEMIPRRYFTGGFGVPADFAQTIEFQAKAESVLSTSRAAVVSAVCVPERANGALAAGISPVPLAIMSLEKVYRTSFAAADSSVRSWTAQTSGFAHYDPLAFTFATKFMRPERLLYPVKGRAQQFYSGSVVSSDYPATFAQQNVGLILDFPDDHLYAMLKHMDYSISTGQRDVKSIKSFLWEHYRKSRANVLYVHGADMNLPGPRELVGNDLVKIASYADNNELIIKNGPDLTVKGILFMNFEEHGGLVFEEWASASMEPVKRAIREKGIPLVIGADSRPMVEEAVAFIKENEPDLEQVRDGIFIHKLHKAAFLRSLDSAMAEDKPVIKQDDPRRELAERIGRIRVRNGRKQTYFRFKWDSLYATPHFMIQEVGYDGRMVRSNLGFVGGYFIRDGKKLLGFNMDAVSIVKEDDQGKGILTAFIREVIREHSLEMTSVVEGTMWNEIASHMQEAVVGNAEIAPDMRADFAKLVDRWRAVVSDEKATGSVALFANLVKKYSQLQERFLSLPHLEAMIENAPLYKAAMGAGAKSVLVRVEPWGGLALVVQGDRAMSVDEGRLGEDERYDFVRQVASVRVSRDTDSFYGFRFTGDLGRPNFIVQRVSMNGDVLESGVGYLTGKFLGGPEDVTGFEVDDVRLKKKDDRRRGVFTSFARIVIDQMQLRISIVAEDETYRTIASRIESASMNSAIPLEVRRKLLDLVADWRRGEEVNAWWSAEAMFNLLEAYEAARQGRISLPDLDSLIVGTPYYKAGVAARAASIKARLEGAAGLTIEMSGKSGAAEDVTQKPVGGVDLNPSSLELISEGALALDLADGQEADFSGLRPVITGIVAVSHLSELMGGAQ